MQTLVQPRLASDNVTNRTVLLVHSRSPLHRELSTDLRFSGYRLFEAASAVDALRIAEREAPKQDIGLLVIDADMMGDTETLALQVEALYSEVRILFIGLRQAPDGLRRPTACLPRPFVRADFSAAVKNLMHTNQAARVPALR